MEEESRQKTDRKRMLGLLTVSCAATLCFAGLYVQEPVSYTHLTLPTTPYV